MLSPVQILRKIQAIFGSVEQESCLKTRHFSALMLSTERETAKDSTDIEVTIDESELKFLPVLGGFPTKCLLNIVGISSIC